MTEQVMLKSSLFNPLLGDNEEGYSLHIPTTSGWQTPDAYSGVNWIFPDKKFTYGSFSIIILWIKSR